MNQGGEVYILKGESDGNPRMISYDKRKKTKVYVYAEEVSFLGNMCNRWRGQLGITTLLARRRLCYVLAS